MVENGAVRSQVHISTLPSARMMRVKCVAYNEVGYVEDTSQDYLNCKESIFVTFAYLFV